MFNIGFSELIVILLVALVFVGPKDLPKVARALGRGIRAIKKMFSEFKEETGLDETIKEIKDVQRDVESTARDIKQTVASPVEDIRQAKTEAENALRGAEQDVKDTLNSEDQN